MRPVDADALKEHKFLTPQVKVIGGRHCGKIGEQIIEAYQKGWNDCIDAIIDHVPTVPLPDFKEGYKQAIRDGKTNFARPQGEWIPVSERLPERYKEVIVTDIETSGTYQSRYVGNEYWECDNGTLKNRIIAWQPLPEPYKKGGAE